MASQPAEQPPTSADPTHDLEAIYDTLQSYPFDTDPEYLSGLASILGHPSTPPTTEELTSNPDLILQVRCFYFARKHNLSPIDPAGYSSWIAQNPQDATTGPTATAPRNDTTTAITATTADPETAPTPRAAAATTQPTSTTASTTEQQQQPPYPTSFAEIVDLITRNVPVPGIETIPDIVLEHGSSKVDHTPRRKKPWESGDAAAAPMTTAKLDTAYTSTDGDGIQPPPASNLINETTQVATADAESSKPDEAAGTDEHAQPNINGNRTPAGEGEGVVKILQPNAIPDSGLLAKD